MKTFEELIKDSEFTDVDLNDVPISGYEIEQRLKALLNGYRLAENLHRKELNKLSFQLNRKMLEGCQGKKLIQFYNRKIGGFLDDFIF